VDGGDGGRTLVVSDHLGVPDGAGLRDEDPVVGPDHVTPAQIASANRAAMPEPSTATGRLFPGHGPRSEFTGSASRVSQASRQ
jgi:hypothetical protein